MHLDVVAIQAKDQRAGASCFLDMSSFSIGLHLSFLVSSIFKHVVIIFQSQFYKSYHNN